MIDKERCSARANYHGTWGQNHQCDRPASLFEDGKGYCEQHAPSAIKAKRDAKFAEYSQRNTIREASCAVEQAAAKIVEAVGRHLILIETKRGMLLPEGVRDAGVEHRQALARLAELKKEGGT